MKIYFNQGKTFSQQEEIDLIEKLNEETKPINGFLGINGDIQVYTEKIETQYRSSLLSPGWWVFFGILGVAGGITTFFVIKKRKKRAIKQ